MKFISSIYPTCGLKDIPSGVYYSPSRVPRRVFPQEESPHRVRVSDHFGSLARVHLHFACSNHCIRKNRVAFPFINGALRHRKIQTYAFMCSKPHQTVSPAETDFCSTCTTHLLQLLQSTIGVDNPHRGLFPHPLVKGNPASPQ